MFDFKLTIVPTGRCSVSCCSSSNTKIKMPNCLKKLDRKPEDKRPWTQQIHKFYENNVHPELGLRQSKRALLRRWLTGLSANHTLLFCRRDSRDRYWRNGDMEAYGEQSYYSREEDNDSITSRDRYSDRQVLRQTGTQTDLCVFFLGVWEKMLNFLFWYSKLVLSIFF